MNKIDERKSRLNPSYVVYILGIAILGLSYYIIKDALGAPLFAFVTIIYLICLRLVGYFLDNRIKQKINS
jgi:hypothetical protein